MYDATVQFKFDATWTPSYSSSFPDDDFVPEEHYLITAPAADSNAKQYSKLFEKFMLCVGMSPASIRSGAMSLVFNDYVNESDQRKICEEYELTMDEDLRQQGHKKSHARALTSRPQYRGMRRPSCRVPSSRRAWTETRLLL